LLFLKKEFEKETADKKKLQGASSMACAFSFACPFSTAYGPGPVIAQTPHSVSPKNRPP
jgi:hypothetical protein